MTFLKSLKIRTTPFIILLVSILFSCEKTPAVQDFCEVNPIDCNKYYDEVTFLTTHNAFNYPGPYLIPNQSYAIGRQLEEGVRGLMIDVYDGPGEALVYHGTPIAGQQKISEVLLPVKNFLDNNPNEIISIIFENSVSNEQLEAGIIAAGLDKYAYIHDGTWPLLKDMVTQGTRLVMFIEQDKSPSTRAAWLHFAWGTIFDTPYTFNSVDEFNSNINRGGSGSKELYLVNHWLSSSLGLPDKSLANQSHKRSILSQRVNDCINTQGHRINFFGVDFYEVGEARAIVDSLNGI